MLRGIVLSVKTSLGGDQLVLRYPPVLRKGAHKHGKNAASFSGEPARNAEASPSLQRTATTVEKPRRDNLRSQSVASSLDTMQPRTAMRRTSIGPEEESKSTAAAGTTDQAGRSSLDDAYAPSPTALNPLFPGPFAQPADPYQMADKVLAHILIPKRVVCNQDFRLTVGDLHFYGHAVVMSSMNDDTNASAIERASSESRSSSSGASATSSNDEVLIFNLTFVTTACGKEEEDRFCSVAQQLAGALRFEEWRCKYVSEQVAKMQSIRDTFAHLPAEERPDHSITRLILKASQLAVELQMIFHSYMHKSRCSIQINQNVNLTFTFKPVAQPVPTMPLRPYHTLILLSDVKRLLMGGGNLPAASSLMRLLDALQPTKSFQMIELETGIPIAHIFHLAAHLVFWGHARVADRLAATNYYALSPDVGSLLNRDVNWRFAQAFPAFSLAEELHRYSCLRTLEEHLHALESQQQKRDFVNVVVWLLQEGVIVQMYEYVYLTTPNDDPPVRCVIDIVQQELLEDLTPTERAHLACITPSRERDLLFRGALNLCATINGASIALRNTFEGKSRWSI